MLRTAVRCRSFLLKVKIVFGLDAHVGLMLRAAASRLVFQLVWAPAPRPFSPWRDMAIVTTCSTSIADIFNSIGPEPTAYFTARGPTDLRRLVYAASTEEQVLDRIVQP